MGGANRRRRRRGTWKDGRDGSGVATGGRIVEVQRSWLVYHRYLGQCGGVGVIGRELVFGVTEEGLPLCGHEVRDVVDAGCKGGKPVVKDTMVLGCDGASAWIED